jgi:anion-transporting  ArsA/GET3 family ATPase
MRNGPSLAVCSAAFLLTFIFILSWHGMSVPKEPTEQCASHLCTAYRVFSEFQTLFAAGLAILAALIAARPVWRQLEKMNVQQDIMAHEFIARRLNSIESKYEYLNNTLSSYLRDVFTTIYRPPYDEVDYDPNAIDVHWAHNMEFRALEIVGNIEIHQKLRDDTSKIEEARIIIIESLRELADCLNDVSAPARYAGDPDISIEQQEEIERQDPIARAKLPDIASKVSAAKQAYISIVDLESRRIRSRLREIDDRMLGPPDEY